MIENIKTALNKIGLSNKETIIYIAIYRIGNSTAGLLSKRTGLNRGTVYSLLKVLEQKGFIYSIEKNEAKHYIAVEPQKLSLIFEKKEKEIEKQKNIIKEIIPEIESLKHPESTKPKITFHEGQSGIRQIHNKIVDSQSDIYSFFPADLIPEYFYSFIGDEFIKKKKAAGIKSLVFAPNCPAGKSVQKKDQKENRKTKLINKEDLEITSEITLFDNKTALISYDPQEMMGTLIESKGITKTLKEIFCSLWDEK